MKIDIILLYLELMASLRIVFFLIFFLIMIELLKNQEFKISFYKQMKLLFEEKVI